MTYFRRSSTGMFASTSLGAHLIRGATAFVLLFWAITNRETMPYSALAAGIAALVAFRGCPMCWTIGLLETLHQKSRSLTRSDSL